MNSSLFSRAGRTCGGFATILFAAIFVILALDLFKPPRDMASLFPTPLPTRRPAPTITPVSYPPTPALSFKDDFSTRSNFPRADNVLIPFGYLQDNSYRLSPPLDPGWTWVLALDINKSQYRNLSINTAGLPAKESAPVEYGILFWHGQDEEGREHFMSFTVSSTNLFRLRAYEPVVQKETGKSDFQWVDLVPPTTTTALYIDGRANHLRVDVHPRRVLAYINDDLVIDTNPPLLTEWRSQRDFDGRVGLIAFAMGKERAEVRFTQFDVYTDE